MEKVEVTPLISDIFDQSYRMLGVYYGDKHTEVDFMVEALEFIGESKEERDRVFTTHNLTLEKIILAYRNGWVEVKRKNKHG